MKGVFVTGTDTDAGKTVIACALVLSLSRRGCDARGLKPVASGSRRVGGLLINDDVMALAAVTPSLSTKDINLACFEPAIAPHLAAEDAGRSVDVASVVSHVRQLDQRYGGTWVIEGAGGWRVPLNDREYFSGIPLDLGLPVVLVVRIRLGCINHAILTAEAIRRDGLTLAGWVANGIPAGDAVALRNVETLSRLLEAPCLGRVPILQDASPDSVSMFLETDSLSAFVAS